MIHLCISRKDRLLASEMRDQCRSYSQKSDREKFSANKCDNVDQTDQLLERQLLKHSRSSSLNGPCYLLRNLTFIHDKTGNFLENAYFKNL